MKFKPGYRIEAFADTGRKRAAFHRKIRDQQERMPLLAELIRKQQPEVDDEMARRAVTLARPAAGDARPARCRLAEGASAPVRPRRQHAVGRPVAMA